MKPGRAQARHNRFCRIFLAGFQGENNIAGHAGHTSKMKPGRAQARHNRLCRIFKRRFKKK